MGLLELWGSRVERELQNEKFLPTVRFGPVPSVYEANTVTIALQDMISIEHSKQGLHFT